MESTTDFDLEELESRLYSQVFHSTENWDSHQNEDFNSCNDETQTRHVSPYTINNIPLNGKRYWDGKNIDNNNKGTTPKQPIINQESTIENNVHQQNNNNILPVLESIIPLENIILEENRDTPLKYKSIIIPSTLQLPKSKIRRLPDEIIHFFKLYNKESKRKFRGFLRFLEKSHSKTNNESSKSDKEKDTIIKLKKPPKITMTIDGKDEIIVLNDIPVKKESESNEVIILTDSDNDSVVEVPLPPIPTYNVDSSSDSDDDDESLKNDVEISENIASSKSDIKDNEEVSISNENNTIEYFNDNSLEKQALQDFESADNAKNKSFTEIENERDEFLHTPDSNNDFLEHDSTISKSNLSFNFGLHSSDLDLSKDKEDSGCKPSAATNDHDLYETESSCSEVGSITKSRAVFNEINFESPIKDIFCEPDLSKFSKFITPNRSTQIKLRQNKTGLNTIFTAIQTKASTKNLEVLEEVPEESKRRNRSESSDYHSDATTLKINKKNKKAKKKTKKKNKQLKNEKNVSEISLLDRNETDSLNDHVSSSTLSASKQIEDLKFGSRSKSDSNMDSNSVSENNLSSEILETDPIENQKEGKDISNYYVDTYFADDCLMLEELEKQPENTELRNESESTSRTTTPNKEIHDSQCKLGNNEVPFSFVETWKKSNKNSDAHEIIETEFIPNKKIKANNSPTIHPYVTTVLSDNEDSDCTIINNDNKNNKTSVRTVTANEDYSDVIIVNIQNDNMNLRPASSEQTNFSFMNTYLQNKDKKTFKDFWTFDMQKFYEDSWGQENFDLKKAQSSMSGKESDWKIIPADLLKISSKKRGPPCLRCREYGHSQYNCTRFSGPLKCSTCGYAGHTYNRCPNAICTTCRSVSHHHTTTCGNCTHFNTIFCTLCKNVGHEIHHCPDLWRRYHLTTDNSAKLKTSSLVLKSPSNRWCCNCSKQGHYEDKCTYLRRVHYPTTSGIISYVPSYNDGFKLPMQAPPQVIPFFKNANITINDLRTLKSDVIISSNKKYINILKQLRQQCHKYNIPLIKDIDRLQRNMNNKEFSKRNINEIYKIRARIAKQKIL